MSGVRVKLLNRFEQVEQDEKWLARLRADARYLSASLTPSPALSLLLKGRGLANLGALRAEHGSDSEVRDHWGMV
jgi:hypothetical protein